MKHNFQKFSVSLVWLWLLFFAVIPAVIVFGVSFLTQDVNHQLIFSHLTSDNYSKLFQTSYFKIFMRSFYLAGGVTLICLLIGYPFAYLLARTGSRYRSLLLLMVIIPFWTSSLVRTYAIVIILKAKGILNSLFIMLGIIDKPMQLLYSNTAVLVGLIYALLPFMVLPLYANIEKLDQRLLEAARDLGASKARMFLKIILPLTWSGIIAGSILVFLPGMSLFYIPDLLGGAKSLLVGNLIENQFLGIHDWPTGAALSILLTLLMGILLLIYWLSSRGRDKGDSLI